MSGREYRSANEARRQRRLIQGQEEMVQIQHKQRHECLMSAVNTRAPLLREEHDIREEAFKNFRRSLVEIEYWEKRLSKKTAKEDARHDKLSENVSRVVSLEINKSIEAEEFELRRQIVVGEDKCRRMLWRIMAHDKYLIDCLFGKRKLVNCEHRIRKTFESDEQSIRDSIQADYDKKPWQPYSQLFGVCPFHKEKDCPFSNVKKARLLQFPVDPDHFCRSLK